MLFLGWIRAIDRWVGSRVVHRRWRGRTWPDQYWKVRGKEVLRREKEEESESEREKKSLCDVLGFLKPEYILFSIFQNKFCFCVF